MNDRTRSQNEAILEYLQAGNVITALDALNRFNCLRLAARIRELRKAGNVIITRRVTTRHGARIAEYGMAA